MVYITDLRLSLSGKRLENTTVQCSMRLAECVPSRNGHKFRFREKKKDTVIGVHLRTMPTGKSTSIKRELSGVESFSFLIKQAILQEEKKRKKTTRNKATLFTLFKLLYQRWGTLVIRAVYGTTDQRSKQIDQWILGLNTRAAINWILMKLFIGSVVYVG